MPTLLCPVRGCHRPLTREEHRAVCPRAHSFDVARSGYINLLQPQDRRSRQPGDAADTVAARRRFLAHGFEKPIFDATFDVLSLSPDDAVLEVGCGDGYHLAALVDRFGCEGHGLDISMAAIAAAAKRYRRLLWVIANADRFVPYADSSFGAVTSIMARVNAAEYRRVVRADGVLLVAVPAPDDLIELRRAILGEGILRDRVDRAVATCAPLFTLYRHERIRHTAHLDAGAVADVLAGSYRAMRRAERVRVAAIGAVDVTLSRDILLFRPAPPTSSAPRRVRGEIDHGSRLP